MKIGTEQTRIRCKCPSGHSFSTSFFVSIDISTQPGILESLSDGGTQLVCCPQCTATWPLVEPISIHHPKEERFALFIPQMLSHKEWKLRAELMTEISRCKPDLVPPYVSDFEIIVGTDALAKWVSSIKQQRSTNPAPNSTSQGSTSQIIHKAFADLMPSDSQLSDMTKNTKVMQNPVSQTSDIDFAGLLSKEEDEAFDEEKPEENDAADDIEFNLANNKNSG